MKWRCLYGGSDVVNCAGDAVYAAVFVRKYISW